MSSANSPIQSFPPHIGEGFVHVRFLVCLPVPHGLSHTLHSPHELHPPSILIELGVIVVVVGVTVVVVGMTAVVVEVTVVVGVTDFGGNCVVVGVLIGFTTPGATGLETAFTMTVIANNDTMNDTIKVANGIKNIIMLKLYLTYIIG